MPVHTRQANRRVEVRKVMPVHTRQANRRVEVPKLGTG